VLILVWLHLPLIVKVNKRIDEGSEVVYVPEPPPTSAGRHIIRNEHKKQQIRKNTDHSGIQRTKPVWDNPSKHSSV
jgi:hypothetical protein